LEEEDGVDVLHKIALMVFLLLTSAEKLLEFLKREVAVLLITKPWKYFISSCFYA